MRLGIGIGLSQLSSGAAAPAVSLYDTSDLASVASNLDPTHQEILDADSWRQCRSASANRGDYEITGVPSGDYRITGTVSAYDGAVSISFIQLRIDDAITNRASITVAGPLDVTVTISSGTLRFTQANNDRGARVDDFLIVAA